MCCTGQIRSTAPLQQKGAFTRAAGHVDDFKSCVGENCKDGKYSRDDCNRSKGRTGIASAVPEATVKAALVKIVDLLWVVCSRSHHSTCIGPRLSLLSQIL